MGGAVRLLDPKGEGQSGRGTGGGQWGSGEEHRAGDRHEVQEAVRITPDHAQAGRRLDLLSRPLDEDIQHPLFRSLGLRLAFLGYDLDPTTASADDTVELTLWWQGLATVDRD